MELNRSDLIFCLRRLPKTFLQVIKRPHWHGKVFIGGGFIRSVIQNENINDIDIFVPSSEYADRLALELKAEMNVKRIHRTEYAQTLVGTKPTIQVIHKWVFDSPEQVIRSFDFTICAAVIWFDGHEYKTSCFDTYYQDLAAKRLVYTSPERIEEAGGSTLRVLKYYQKGFRIPLDSMGAVLARLFMAIDMERIRSSNPSDEWELQTAKVITGLLRSVDPLIDPTREAHLPSQDGGVDVN